MTNTALRAENSNSRTITFKSRGHEKFYEEYLKKCRYQDVNITGTFTPLVRIEETIVPD